MTTDANGPRYRPGDTANGYVMSSDGEWLPAAGAPRPAAPAGRGYWSRFGHRLPFCMLGVGLVLFVGLVVNMVNVGGSSVAYVFGEAVGGGLLYSIPVGLIAALFPSGGKPRK